MLRSISTLFCALAALGLAASVASAEIYRWTDESGNRHLTNELSEVPPQFRDAAIADLNREGGSLNVIGDGGSTSTAAAQPQAAAPAAGAEQESAPGGHDESWWRSQAMELERNAEAAQEQYEAAAEQAEDEVTVGRIPGSGVRGPDNSRRRVHRNRAPRVAALSDDDGYEEPSVDALEQRMNQSQRELEDFHDQARRAGVPPGWLR
jgi:hypothetical protein